MKTAKENDAINRFNAFQGIFLKTLSKEDKDCFSKYLIFLGLNENIKIKESFGGIYCCLSSFNNNCLYDNYDTSQIITTLDVSKIKHLHLIEFEIIAAMLISPELIVFESYQELLSSIRIRKNIVEAAKNTLLSFDTESAERPEDFWKYSEETGFTILSGVSLKTALIKATQPTNLEQPYSFSCWRATEYIYLLSLTKELEECNPLLLKNLETQWEKCAIKSDAFNDSFLTTLGSYNKPIPTKYYIPGDRVWFRNPDRDSYDVTGYEGSFVFYLGSGFFSNFWKKDNPYTLNSKCIEIYHWRNGLVKDANGIPTIDESIVENLVSETFADLEKTQNILNLMLKIRDLDGDYLSGGCVDFNRAYIRNVCVGTADLSFNINSYL